MKDGGTYVAMPLNIAGSTYDVEFREELPHNEVITQKWPVTPYQVNQQQYCLLSLSVELSNAQSCNVHTDGCRCECRTTATRTSSRSCTSMGRK
jgi:hypothetical protein